MLACNHTAALCSGHTYLVGCSKTLAQPACHGCRDGIAYERAAGSMGGQLWMSGQGWLWQLTQAQPHRQHSTSPALRPSHPADPSACWMPPLRRPQYACVQSGAPPRPASGRASRGGCGPPGAPAGAGEQQAGAAHTVGQPGSSSWSERPRPLGLPLQQPARYRRRAYLQPLCVLHPQHAAGAFGQQQQHALVAGGEGGDDVLARWAPAHAGGGGRGGVHSAAGASGDPRGTLKAMARRPRHGALAAPSRHPISGLPHMAFPMSSA